MDGMDRGGMRNDGGLCKLKDIERLVRTNPPGPVWNGCFVLSNRQWCPCR